MVDVLGSLDGLSRIESIDIRDDLLLLVTSSFGGNTWNSSLQVINLIGDVVCASIQRPSGGSDARWWGQKQSAIIAEDSGDVKVLHMMKNFPRLAVNT